MRFRRNPQASPPLQEPIRAFFSGRNAFWIGGALASLTFVWECTKDRAAVALDKARDLFFVTVDIRSHQPEHIMLLEWIAKHPRAKTAHSLSIVTDLSNGYEPDSTLLSLAQKKVTFTLNYGIHVLTYNNHWMWVERRIDRDRKDSFNAEPHEILTLTMFAPYRQDLLEIVEEARRQHVASMSERTAVWMPEATMWRRLCCKAKRPIDSLYLPEGMLNDLVVDCNDYLSGKEAYARRGIPWRRGYFLYGPPGTGKSSFIYCLAGHFNLPVYILPLTSMKLDDLTLLRLMNTVPERSIVVIEDVEVLTRSDGITLGGLLNAIDGIASSEGRLLMMTSNHPHKLPAALLRAGRIDRRIEFGPMDVAQLGCMYQRFHPQEDGGGGGGCPPQLLEALAPQSITPAQFQNFLLEGGDDTSLEKIQRWKKIWLREDEMCET